MELLIALALLDVLGDGGTDYLRYWLIVDRCHGRQLIRLLSGQPDCHGLGRLHGPNVATYPCEIDGVAIDGCAEIFRYTNAGELTEASGPLSVTGAYTLLGDYPLASPRDAVSGVEFDASSHGSANPTTAAVVTLTSSTLVYEVATMTNGSTTLVPAYSYTGSNGGTGYTAIAVSPSLVRERT